ncbi:hypothetical protein MLD38_000950 [Melastoma candidum]|uniref:Uncharacterized protein n=1 Tax=Melastoma candidum TaxID=119954 RepID=A0ACB9SGL8_9MYRT|nr:hypothetical protein MLD38_000950 [Melastoma candidum]
MANRNVLTLSQVSKHKSKIDCWVVIDGRVLNVTKFLEEHPGGDDVLLEVAGKDSSKEFYAVGHSKAAQNLLLKYQVGTLEGYVLQETDDGKQASVAKETKKEMSAFVVKDDAIQKFAPLLELFVPLAVAGSYFCYRYITAVSQI